MTDDLRYDWQDPNYRPFDLGEVISRSFGCATAHFLRVLPLSLILVAAPALVVYSAGYLVEQPGFMPKAMVLIGSILFMIGSVLLPATLIQVFVRYFWADPIDPDRALKIAFGRFWPIIGGGILAGLGIMAGFILLLVPGFILYCGWFVFLPVVVGEKLGPVDSLSRSWVLTKGYKWQILVIILVSVVIAMVIGAVAGGIGGAFVGIEAVEMSPDAAFGRVLLFALIQAVVAAISAMISAAFCASTYVELMRVKGEHDATAAPDIFDEPAV